MAGYFKQTRETHPACRRQVFYKTNSRENAITSKPPERRPDHPQYTPKWETGGRLLYSKSGKE
eukprot:scaffold5540_cov181-Amphora_coffeaeformis.AAC.9